MNQPAQFFRKSARAANLNAGKPEPRRHAVQFSRQRSCRLGVIASGLNMTVIGQQPRVLPVGL